MHKASAVGPRAGAGRPPRALALLLRTGAIAGFVFGTLVLIGLARFAIPPAAENEPVTTDAIVVLTGGSLRLQSGIELMRRGKGRTLFVSGVNYRVHLDQLLRSAGQERSHWLICCIVLGHDARNTAGNAEETAQWMRRQGFHSLRLVTAWYHMPRSLLEFERAMPEVEVIPHPVFSDESTGQNWYGWHGTATVLSAEYLKYLAALLFPGLDRPTMTEPHEVAAEARR